MQRLREPRFQAGVAREPEHVLEAGVLAPAQDVLAAEPGIAAHPDPGPGPASADLRHDPRQFVHRACRRIDIGRAQPGAQHVLAAGDIQRQIAVVPVVAVEEPALLATVQRIVGGVEIEYDLRRRGGMGLQEQVHQQPVDRFPVGGNPLVAVPGRRFRYAELQAVQRARSRQRMPPVPRPPPPLPGHVRTPARQREGAVGAQPVMVVEILVARRQGQHPLRHQRLQTVLDAAWVAVVAEARRQPRRHPEAPVDLPQQQHAAVRRQPAAVEPAHHRPPAKAFKRQLRRGTVCVHGVAPSWPVRVCLSYLYHAFPLHAPPAGEISGLAGRTLEDDAGKLTLFAVGDDDQNIYAFNGASVEFIRRFEADYGPKPRYLSLQTTVPRATSWRQRTP